MGDLTYPGYKQVPVTYLLCGNDLTIATEMQQQFVGLLEKESPDGVDVSRIKSDHFPHVCHPDEVLRAIRRAAGEDVVM